MAQTAPKKLNSFSFVLTPPQQAALRKIFAEGNFRPRADIPYTVAAVEAPGLSVKLYESGKCLIQGKRAAEFLEFTFEPQVLGSAVAPGYEDLLHPERVTPHFGSDESGKGDFFGPLVVCAVYADAELAPKLAALGARDCKKIADSSCLRIAEGLRAVLGPQRYALVLIRPPKYNELYGKIGNLNRFLAWAHATALQQVMDGVPGCSRALVDQFANPRLVAQQLQKASRKLELEQHPRAESDIAVAAASVIARATFLTELASLAQACGVELPKGCSNDVQAAGAAFIARHGADKLGAVAKLHFKTAEALLGQSRV